MVQDEQQPDNYVAPEDWTPYPASDWVDSALDPDEQLPGGWNELTPEQQRAMVENMTPEKRVTFLGSHLSEFGYDDSGNEQGGDDGGAGE